MSEDDDTRVTVSSNEAFWLWLLRRNASIPRREIYWKRSIGMLQARFRWSSKSNMWGRFGGGWNWMLGFQSGGSTVSFHLLIATLSFSWLARKEPADE